MSERIDCFEVTTNEHGERASYAKYSFQSGELVYTIRGEASEIRTRDTIEIGPGQHVLDYYALYLNHSFTPNLRVSGREIVALVEITVGDELTFNYLESESEIAAPFVCHNSGRSVSSDTCEASKC